MNGVIGIWLSWGCYKKIVEENKKLVNREKSEMFVILKKLKYVFVIEDLLNFIIIY